MRRNILDALLIVIVAVFSACHATERGAAPIVGVSTSPGTSNQVEVTLPLEPNSIRFAVIGDSGTGDHGQYEVANEMEKMRQVTKFDFVLMLGDNLYHGSSSRDYATKFERPYKALLDDGVKFYATLGNHDNVNEISYAPFNMGAKQYYTFTKGDIEFLVLDSNYLDGTQLGWLETELEKSASPWKIAYFHHPLYSSGKRHGSDADLRTVLEPVFKKYNVSIVLSGHDHVYERIGPQSGILYFVVGSSGHVRSHGLEENGMKADGFDTDLCFMVAEISGDEFYFQTISRTGSTIDKGSFKRRNRAASTGPSK